MTTSLKVSLSGGLTGPGTVAREKRLATIFEELGIAKAVRLEIWRILSTGIMRRHWRRTNILAAQETCSTDWLSKKENLCFECGGKPKIFSGVLCHLHSVSFYYRAARYYNASDTSKLEGTATKPSSNQGHMVRKVRTFGGVFAAISSWVTERRLVRSPSLYPFKQRSEDKLHAS